MILGRWQVIFEYLLTHIQQKDTFYKYRSLCVPSSAKKNRGKPQWLISALSFVVSFGLQHCLLTPILFSGSYKFFAQVEAQLSNPVQYHCTQVRMGLAPLQRELLSSV